MGCGSSADKSINSNNKTVKSISGHGTLSGSLNLVTIKDNQQNDVKSQERVVPNLVLIDQLSKGQALQPFSFRTAASSSREDPRGYINPFEVGKERYHENDDFKPNLLFTFDLKEKFFYYYNLSLNHWDKNDLTMSTDAGSKCPLFKFKNNDEASESVDFAKYMSCIAINNYKVLIIGGCHQYYSCLEYDIEKNTFICKKPLKDLRNNPSLCVHGKDVYVVSGDSLDAYSQKVSKYDYEINDWTSLPDLPIPQGMAATSIICDQKEDIDVYDFDAFSTCSNEKKSYSLAVLGGYKAKLPRIYSSILSLYSLKEERWKLIDLQKVLSENIPKFINCIFSQTTTGDFIILGGDKSRKVYNYNMLTNKLLIIGKLGVADTFNQSLNSNNLIQSGEKFYCLSHAASKRIHKGVIHNNIWELI